MRVEREGLGYRAAIVSEGIALSVDRLTEHNGELYGELTVERAPEGHLMRSRLSLSNSNARTGAANYLVRRSRGPDWLGYLEQFFVAVLGYEREGAPLVTIGKRPARPAVEFLLDPMLPIGKPTILFGEEGTGKSTLAAAIAVSVASGRAAYSKWWVPVARPVLVLDWEGDEHDWNDLIAGVSAGMDIEPPEVSYLASAGPLTNDVHRIARLVAESEAGLMIVDSVGLASPQGGSGADASEGALRLFAALRLLGTTTLLIDHVNKSADTHQSSRPYGSVYKPALARATYELRAAEEADEDGTRHLALFHRKGNTTRRQKPVGIKVQRSEQEIVLAWEEIQMSDKKLAAGATLVERIKSALKAGPLLVEEIAEEAGSTDVIVKATLSRAAKPTPRNPAWATRIPGGEGKTQKWALLFSETRYETSYARDAKQVGDPLKGSLPHRVTPSSRPFDSLERLNERRPA